MKILTDEHVPRAVATTLQSEGIETITIYDTELLGVNDPPLLDYATKNGYVILTNDQDFVSKEFVETATHPRIFFYEDQRLPRSDLVRAVHNALSVLRPEDLQNEIVYIPNGWM